MPEQQEEVQSRQGTQPSSPAASLCSRSEEQLWLLLLLLLREDGLTWLAGAKSTFLEAARQSSGLCPSALSQIHPLILGAPALGCTCTVQRSVCLAVPYGRSKRLLLWNLIVLATISAFPLSFLTGGIQGAEGW